MIISERVDKERNDFENLLKESHRLLTEEVKIKPQFFLKRSASEFEKDTYEALCSASKGTDFESTIFLVSGSVFPDIVVKKFYGVEVKTSQKSWKSVGNSVLESTRVRDVERIYIFFAKLSHPLGFKYRLYQDCLSDIAVTHSPRYLIDMDLEAGKSIFEQMGIGYDQLRKRENPIKPFVDYYRKLAKPGEEPWWMDAETPIKPTVSLWSNLGKEKQDELRIEVMARFPELFGNSRAKYQALASYLAARHGVVDSSLRDRFSAGGQGTLKIGKKSYAKLPRVFAHLQHDLAEILQYIKLLPPEEAAFYWKLSVLPKVDRLASLWVKKVLEQIEDDAYLKTFISDLFSGI
jgi:hypothetical protein